MTQPWKKRMVREVVVVFSSVIWGGFLVPSLLMVLCVVVITDRSVMLSERPMRDLEILRSLMRSPLSNRLGWTLVLGSYFAFQIIRLIIWAVRTRWTK